METAKEKFFLEKLKKNVWKNLSCVHVNFVLLSKGICGFYDHCHEDSMRIACIFCALLPMDRRTRHVYTSSIHEIYTIQRKKKDLERDLPSKTRFMNVYVCVCVFLCLWMSVRVWESDCVCILQFFMINFLQFPFCPMILKWNLWFLFITTKKNTWRWVCNTLYNLYISSAIKISMTCKTIWTI